MASRTNQATWSDHDSKWNLCDSIWNRRKGGNVEVILDQKDLGITNRLRRAQGRPNRTRSIATRFTPDEEQELKLAAAARGSFIAEWAREVLLCEARTRRFDAAVITEVVALRMLVSTVLRSIALKETLTSEAFTQILSDVRSGKHDATRDVLNQYQTRTREQ
jgi:hypothetical protein